MTWKEDVEKVAHGTATREEFVDAITQWLFIESLSGSTEGIFEACSRRVVWVFPNKYVFAIGTAFTPSIFSLDSELNADSALPLPEKSGAELWEFDRSINGWHYESDDELSIRLALNIVDLLSEANGKPFVLLPWDTTWATNIAEEELDDYLSNWGVEEDEEGYDEYVAMHSLATLAVNGELNGKTEWKVELSDEEDGISQFSDHYKFFRLISHIEENSLMIVDLDQHCAACSHGTYEYAVKQNPKLEGKGTFRTWGQNSEWMYPGDGNISVNVWFENKEEERMIAKLAQEEFGLNVGYDDDEKVWSPTGEIHFGQD